MSEQNTKSNDLITIAISPKSVDCRTSAKGTPYLYVPYTANFKKKGVVDRTAMAWGQAAESMKDKLAAAAAKGESIKVFGRFEEGVFSIIGESAPRQQATA